MSLTRAVVLGTLGAAMVSPACGGGGDGGSGPGQTLAISAGNGQTGNAGAPLANPLAVIVREATTNNPVPDVTISWAVTRGGGSVTTPSVTDATGIATATRTLGADSVSQSTTASGTGLSPVAFTSTSRIQGATQMALSAGNTQSDTIGATLGTAYAVVVRNEASVAVAAVTVNWSAAGGGTVSAPTSLTNASGIATVNRILGTTAGAQTAQARVTGLNGNPVSFTATATAGNAVSIEKTAGDGGSAVINGQVTYTVTARDRGGNARSGVTVNWDTTGGGGSISPAQNATGATGQASATRTLSGTAGPHTARATASSIPGGPSVTFTTNATTAPLAANVSVVNDNFNPAATTIAVTGTVTWNWNSGGLNHNVTFAAMAGAPANIPDRGTGSIARTFNTAGTFNYQCTLHAGMNGSVTAQ